MALDGVTSATAPAPVGTQTLNGAHVALNFRDEYSVRLAGEYMGFDWPIRFGMIYGTPVTDRAVARANLTPPGSSYVLSAGTGKEVKVGETSLLNFDGALEYDMVTGDSDGGNAPGAAIDSNGGTTRMGTYKVSAYAMHLGVGYSF
jgi:long-subunit fatty acid transport protein